MSGLNRATIIGHLGADPEIRYTTNGSAVANLRVATSEQWKDKQTGEKQERTEWHTVTMFGKLAEIAGEYLGKGQQVYIEGRLQTDKWQDRDGNDRYTTKIIANQMQMLGGKPQGQYGNTPQTDRDASGATATDNFEDDIPFN